MTCRKLDDCFVQYAYGLWSETLCKTCRRNKMYNILITGGSGCLGTELVRQLYNDDSVGKIIVYSRSESRQAIMKESFPEYPKNKMRYYLGCVTNQDRLVKAMRNVDVVIHAAALKRVETCALDVEECLRTNILGTQAVANACIKAGVKKAIYISTDKAVEATTTYGKSKAFSEDLFIQMNNYHSTKFSAVRYANVEASTGSLLTIWDKQIKDKKPLTVTHKDMTRMWLTVNQAAKLVLDIIESMVGGEIYVPKLTGKNIYIMAIDYLTNNKCVNDIVVTGMRPHEKLHEILISEADARECYDEGDRYCIYPAIHDWVVDYSKKGRKVSESFRMSSEIKFEENAPTHDHFPVDPNY
jgi:UDP-N-acetylglucosamine 4,6-dehydratase